VFTLSSVVVSMFCTDLGSVVHTIGGTAAACLIFLNPGLMLINAAIIKHSTGMLRDITARRTNSLQNPLPECDAAGVLLQAEEDESRVPFLHQVCVGTSATHHPVTDFQGGQFVMEEERSRAAPPALLQNVHVKNRCAWLRHSPTPQGRSVIAPFVASF
jgi:hypothetical protein